MTAQAPDTITIDGKELCIAAVRGRKLFDPAACRLSPVRTSTALMRGYLSHYTIARGSLLLDALSITLESEPPSLYGVTPEVRVSVSDARRGLFSQRNTITPKRTFYHAQYAHLGHNIQFSGNILAGVDFIDSLYVHGGFPLPWKFQVVRELTFDAGTLVQDIDRSMDAEAFRARQVAEGTRPDGALDQGVLCQSDHWLASPEHAGVLADALVLQIMAEQNPYIGWRLARQWAEIMALAGRAPRELTPSQIAIGLRNTYDRLYGPSFPHLDPTDTPYTGPKEVDPDGVEITPMRPLVPMGFAGPIDLSPEPLQKSETRAAAILEDPHL